MENAKEREILEQSIKEHQTAIDKAQKELKDLDKPVKLRHGDYGYAKKNGVSIIFVKICGEPRYYTGGVNGLWSNLVAEKEFDTPPLGNIFDDLERNSKDLWDFTKKTAAGGKLQVRITFVGQIEFSIRQYTATAFLDESIEIQQLLSRLNATARRKNANKNNLD